MQKNLLLDGALIGIAAVLGIIGGAANVGTPVVLGIGALVVFAAGAFIALLLAEPRRREVERINAAATPLHEQLEVARRIAAEQEESHHREVAALREELQRYRATDAAVAHVVTDALQKGQAILARCTYPENFRGTAASAAVGVIVKRQADDWERDTHDGLRSLNVSLAVMFRDEVGLPAAYYPTLPDPTDLSDEPPRHEVARCLMLRRLTRLKEIRDRVDRGVAPTDSRGTARVLPPGTGA